MKAHKGQKFIRTFSPRLTAYSTFSLTQLQSSKSKLPSSGNQGLYLTTVWRQASIHWHKTNSPWTLNKWWSKVEKWWGFPAVCRITPHVPTSVGPNSRIQTLAKGIHQVPVRAPLVTVFVDWDPGTGVDKKKEAGYPHLKTRVLFFAETHVYVSSYKVALVSKKIEQKQSQANNNLQRARKHSISWVRGA